MRLEPWVVASGVLIVASGVFAAVIVPGRDVLFYLGLTVSFGPFLLKLSWDAIHEEPDDSPPPLEASRTRAGADLVSLGHTLGLQLPRALAERLRLEVQDPDARARRVRRAAERHAALAPEEREDADFESLLGFNDPQAPEVPDARLRPAEDQVVPVSGDQHCPYCREALGAVAGGLTSCAACRTVLHKECLAELGGCPTQACRNNRRDRLRG